jgi:crotonobetainyl-CoA:carnitine CoA-transferase CaiB-like acyl-CoA transferase
MQFGMPLPEEAGGGGAWPSVESPDGPLAGLKVLDLSRVLAGPFATMLLGDLGADVVKVESPGGDVTRHWGPPFVGDTAVYFLTTNRNKRSVVLDLTQPDDRAAALRLAATADVVVENFRPGGAARFALAYADVRAVNPRCVYCSITGFGTGSEREDEPAYDLVVQAAGGMMGVTGVDGTPPVKVGVATADLLTGLYASTAILAGLSERERTGAGVDIEVPLMDAQVAGLGNQALNWLAAGLNPSRLGSDHPNVAPYGAYATGSSYVVVAVGNDAQFAQLAAAVGRPEWLQDPRFATNRARVANRAALRDELQSVLDLRPADEWLAVLRAAGVPCGPVRDVAGVFADPEVRARTVRSVPHPTLGEVPQVLSPFRFRGRPTEVRMAPPELGQHTDEVLSRLTEAR